MYGMGLEYFSVLIYDISPHTSLIYSLLDREIDVSE